MMACAAARGSGAAMIGRATTRWLAPALLTAGGRRDDALLVAMIGAGGADARRDHRHGRSDDEANRTRFGGGATRCRRCLPRGPVRHVAPPASADLSRISGLGQTALSMEVSTVTPEHAQAGAARRAPRAARIVLG